ncbi:MAG: hypothetical protein ABR572_12760 [Cryomorphaceae bacterium]|nr:hypothetical protein [Flavobacteriales bacterium]
MVIKRLIVKYLAIIIGLVLMRILLSEWMPELFTETIEGEGYITRKNTFFNVYQQNFSNIIIGIVMTFDLKGSGRNRVLIPLLTVISLTAGLFFFAILMLDKIIHGHERN